MGFVAVERVNPLHDCRESFRFVLSQWPTGSPYGDPAGLDALPLSYNVSHELASGGFGLFFGEAFDDVLALDLEFLDKLKDWRGFIVVILQARNVASESGSQL